MRSPWQAARLRPRAALWLLVALAGLFAAAPLMAQDDSYRPPNTADDAYDPDDDGGLRDQPPRREGRRDDGEGYGEPYGEPPPPRHGERYGDGGPPPYRDETYGEDEILGAGKRAFGSISEGLARVVEHAFRRQGRPNGYILGEDAGGAFVAGLRYGKGTLYTKYDGDFPIYWQGPSVGYDFGGEGSKTMVLVYNLREPSGIYRRFAGVQGSAYLVGGVGIQFQKYGDVVLAPIRSGVGLRFGANVGYLKYTRYPTWNPF